MKKPSYRTESDSMGEMQVPLDAYWGPQTQRAVENFPVSGLRFPRSFIRALGLIKVCAAQVNARLGHLDAGLAGAIERAAREVADGGFDGQFVVDVFQTGSGTSTNMNANEVIANRANQILGGKIGDKGPIHPNDHVNMSQSSNDVIPSCIHIAALLDWEETLLPALRALASALESKAAEFAPVLKIGRTHLQDATPIRLGQEFGGYASMVRHAVGRVERSRSSLRELALGGTAVGTGINAPAGFAPAVIEALVAETGLELREADNHFEAQGSRDAVVEAASALKTAAVGLFKIANDIRWLGSGPRCGLGEIHIPAVQPGSSIMPGKVNPVMAESLCQAAVQVIGNEAAISAAGLMGNFELNVMMPVMAHNLLQSIALLANAVHLFTEKCVQGLKADEKRCAEMVELSLAMATALSPRIGYDKAAEIAKEAYASGRTVRAVAEEKALMPKEELDRLLDPWAQTGA